MSKRIKTPQSLGRDYKKMLKDYFGKYLYGLMVEEKGGCVEVQVVYYDFKHVSTVRRELAQMMPEVEFTKIKRDYTDEAQKWALCKLIDDELNDAPNVPVIYVEHGDSLVKSSIFNLAVAELNQLELDDEDINYPENSLLRHCATFDDDKLRDNSWE